MIGILAAYEVFYLIVVGYNRDRRALTGLGKESVIRLFILFANATFFIVLRGIIIGEALQVGRDVFRHLENPIAFSDPGLPKALSIGWISLVYLGLLVLPTSQSCDYSFDCLPLIESVSDPRTLVVVAAALVFVLLCAKAAYDGIVRREFALASGLVWLVLPFLPSSHIFVEIGTLVAERLLYFPSIGYCLLFGGFLGRISFFFFFFFFLFFLLVNTHHQKQPTKMTNNVSRFCDPEDH